MRILIIEDEHLIQECFYRIALMRGHTVKSEKNGLNGLKIWKEFQPHLVFLDILIPGMDGPTVLKNVHKTNNAKVVMMSAHRAYVDGLKIPNVDLFVTKPFSDIVTIFKQAEQLCFSYQQEFSI